MSYDNDNNPSGNTESGRNRQGQGDLNDPSGRAGGMGGSGMGGGMGGAGINSDPNNFSNTGSGVRPTNTAAGNFGGNRDNTDMDNTGNPVTDSQYGTRDSGDTGFGSSGRNTGSDTYGTTDTTGGGMGRSDVGGMGRSGAGLTSTGGTGVRSAGGADTYGSSDTADLGSSNLGGRAGNRDDDYGSGGQQGKVGMGDKIRGGAEKMAGKVTGNAGLVEKGEERKTGNY